MENEKRGFFGRFPFLSGVLVGIFAGALALFLFLYQKGELSSSNKPAQLLMEDYLRLAVKAYADDQNAELAKRRYALTGTGGDEILRLLEKDSYTDPLSLLRFMADVNWNPIAPKGAAIAGVEESASPLKTAEALNPEASEKPVAPAAKEPLVVDLSNALQTSKENGAVDSAKSSPSKFSGSIINIVLIILIIAFILGGCALVILAHQKSRKTRLRERRGTPSDGIIKRTAASSDEGPLNPMDGLAFEGAEAGDERDGFSHYVVERRTPIYDEGDLSSPDNFLQFLEEADEVHPKKKQFPEKAATDIDFGIKGKADSSPSPSLAEAEDEAPWDDGDHVAAEDEMAFDEDEAPWDDDGHTDGIKDAIFEPSPPHLSGEEASPDFDASDTNLVQEIQNSRKKDFPQPAFPLVPAELINIASVQPIEKDNALLAQFTAAYQLKDDLFDETFSIMLDDIFLGECGIGIAETLNNTEPKAVTAFEIWLFDINDLHTPTHFLLSDFAYENDGLINRLKPKGSVERIRKSGKYEVNSHTMRMTVTVSDFVYGTELSEKNSYFNAINFQVDVWKK